MSSDSASNKISPRNSPTKQGLMMDQESSYVQFQHSWWKMALIILAVLVFILTCIFNGLSSTGSNGVFTQRTGDVSDQNLTEFTPAGWTFSIWGIIYFWQAAWLVYALSRIPRKSNKNYLYISPNTLHFTVFISYALNLALNIAWLIIWDRQHFGWAAFVIFFMLITVLIPLIITHILLQRNRDEYIESGRKVDIWLVRFLVHNGLAVYTTWLYLATLLNFTIWVSRIYNRDAQSISDVSTAALSLVLIGIVVYFVCENLIFYSAMAYTYLPWFVLIFALSGIMSNNYNRTDVSSRNKQFTLALLILCCILFAIRVVIFIIRYIMQKIPTFKNP